ncbi:hypothetical protein ES705_23568 [subsurface metagenome]
MKAKKPTITVLTSLYRCEKYLNSYFQHLSKTSGLDEVEILLLHNEPTNKELEVVESCMLLLGKCVRHIVIEKRESYYKSLNRGVDLAEGKYIAIWNVDDIRMPDSLQRQALTLDQYTDVGFTYGDTIETPEYGKIEGKFCCHPEYEENPTEFLRSYFGSCFPMWRKSIHERVGYFDEQLFSGGDFDFWLRVVHLSRLKKTKGPLGYFLNEGKGLSTVGWRNAAERTVIELRYGIFDKINFLFLYSAIKNYRIHSIFRDGIPYKISKYIPNYSVCLLKRLPLFPWGMVKYPLVYLIPKLAKIIHLSFTLGPRAVIHKLFKILGL